MTNANGIPTSLPLDSNQEPIQNNILLDRLHIYDYVHSCFKVRRAHSYLDMVCGKEYTDAITAASLHSPIKDPLWPTVLYDIIYDRMPEPPDGFLLKAFTFMAIIFVYLYPIIIGLVRLFHHRVTRKAFVNEPLSLTPIKKRRRHRRCTKM